MRLKQTAFAGEFVCLFVCLFFPVFVLLLPLCKLSVTLYNVCKKVTRSFRMFLQALMTSRTKSEPMNGDVIDIETQTVLVVQRGYWLLGLL